MKRVMVATICCNNEGNLVCNYWLHWSRPRKPLQWSRP
jgi:hypothetical protein